MMNIVLLIALILVILLYVVNTYNKFIQYEELIENSKAQIATQVESRWDALSSLISATKQYSTHEAETFQMIVRDRQQVNSFTKTEDIDRVETTYQSSLSRLIAITEDYPDLKASSLYKETMASINKYEHNVRLSRMTFNDTVTKYNRLIKMFPTNLIAALISFEKKPYLEVSSNKLEMPDWS